MSDSIITPEAATFGGAMWFADKVLGPSADAMGQQLKAYLQSRCPVIFGRAAEIAQERGIEPREIKPGLLARLIMDASFSNEEEEITEWWANLLLDASIQGSNEHAVFSDIMALLGPREVQCLDEFIKSFPSCSTSEWGKDDPWNLTIHSHFDGAVRAWIGEENLPDRHSEIVMNFLHGDPSWPARPTEWLLPFRRGDGEIQDGRSSDNRFKNNRLSFDILQRAGILAPLDVTMSLYGGELWVRGIGLTPLGYEFYRACKGLRL